MKAADIHYHRNGQTLVLNGVMFYGIKEDCNIWVSQEGTFVTKSKQKGDYRGYRCTSGYMQVFVAGRSALAHRVVYEVWSGQEIEIGHEIDHMNAIRDDNRFVNLRCVTASENVRNTITYVRLTSAGVKNLERFMKNPKNIADRRNAQVEKHGRRIRGTCISTGEVRTYDCIADAARELKICHTNIIVCCKGSIKKTHGWIFRYL